MFCKHENCPFLIKDPDHSGFKELVRAEGTSFHENPCRLWNGTLIVGWLFYGSGVTEKSNQLKLKLKPKGNGMAASIPGQVAGAKPRKKRGEKKTRKILKLKLHIDQRHSPKTHDNTGALSRFFIRWWSMAGRGQILLK